MNNENLSLALCVDPGVGGSWGWSQTAICSMGVCKECLYTAPASAAQLFPQKFRGPCRDFSLGCAGSSTLPVTLSKAMKRDFLSLDVAFPEWLICHAYELQTG